MKGSLLAAGFLDGVAQGLDVFVDLHERLVDVAFQRVDGALKLAGGLQQPVQRAHHEEEADEDDDGDEDPQDDDRAILQPQ